MEQNKTIKLALVIFAVIMAGAVSFYGGMKYGESKITNLQNLTSDQRRQIFQQRGAVANGAQGARTGTDANIARNGAGSVNGEIISKDDKSITVKLRGGGSKIVFFFDKTNILKTAEAGRSDVAVGEQVAVNGNANSDGSMTANIIQLRPALLPVPSGSRLPSSK